LVRQEDMPFSQDGTVPDIIINPHALPSRMTIGHLIEAACSKLACMAGVEIDATPFNGFNPDHIQDALQATGFQKEGYEMMCDGKTGKMLKMPIFLAPTYYQRLKHMVADKQHARSSGPVQMLTRQPMEGRAKDGGLRFGEMERDCLISHGSSYFMRDRLFRSSDYYEVDTCLDCGLFVSVNLKESPVCRSCSSRNIKKIEIPYASKLLFQELISMGIVPRIECK